MELSNEEKFLIAAAALITTAAVVDYVRISRRERKKRDAIKTYHKARMAAIHRATDRMHERIGKGEFTTMTEMLVALKDDIEFETIVNLNEIH